MTNIQLLQLQLQQDQIALSLSLLKVLLRIKYQ